MTLYYQNEKQVIPNSVLSDADYHLSDSTGY